jgi:hypothetical protein
MEGRAMGVMKISWLKSSSRSAISEMTPLAGSGF